MIPAHLNSSQFEVTSQPDAHPTPTDPHSALNTNRHAKLMHRQVLAQFCTGSHVASAHCSVPLPGHGTAPLDAPAQTAMSMQATEELVDVGLLLGLWQQEPRKQVCMPKPVPASCCYHSLAKAQARTVHAVVETLNVRLPNCVPGHRSASGLAW